MTADDCYQPTLPPSMYKGCSIHSTLGIAKLGANQVASQIYPLKLSLLS